jgi:hypothetical protein
MGILKRGRRMRWKGKEVYFFFPNFRTTLFLVGGVLVRHPRIKWMGSEVGSVICNFIRD